MALRFGRADIAHEAWLETSLNALNFLLNSMAETNDLQAAHNLYSQMSQYRTWLSQDAQRQLVRAYGQAIMRLTKPQS